MLFIVHLIILFMVLADGKRKKISCKDNFKECAGRKELCISDPGLMTINCPVTCNTCHLRSAKVRCNTKFLNISTEPALQPGSLDTIFGRLRDDHSLGYKILSSDPWVAEIENFLPDEVINTLLSKVSSWERSTETGQILATGEGIPVHAATRTSSSFSCNRDCYKSSVSQWIHTKISNHLQLPKVNFEYIGLLKYTPGQFFAKHHDFALDELELVIGPRVLTFFLYLSDVEEGGETVFPHINITVVPKKGKAIVWPNVQPDDYTKRDVRSMHESKPVKKGLKYAANVWIHMFEWERPAIWFCSGS